MAKREFIAECADCRREKRNRAKGEFGRRKTKVDREWNRWLDYSLRFYREELEMYEHKVARIKASIEGIEFIKKTQKRGRGR